MNWHERIAAARKRGRFEYDDRNLANSWPDCACGEQDKRIPRSQTGRPLDDALVFLGNRFAYFIENNHLNDAERVLAEIEKRAAVIIAEQEKKCAP